MLTCLSFWVLKTAKWTLVALLALVVLILTVVGMFFVGVQGT